MLFKSLKILFICLRHGINPLSPVEKSERKIAERFSEKEKEWILSITNGYQRGIFKTIFDKKY